MPFSADVLHVLAREVSPHLRFATLHDLVVQLGFDFFGFSCWTSFDPRPLLWSTWPVGWNQNYRSRHYIEVDPRIDHCRRSILPIAWNEEFFRCAPGLWEDAQTFGLCHGWSQGSHSEGVFSILDVARQTGPIGAEEWYEKAGQVLLLCNLIHMNQVEELKRKIAALSLTCREIEVLRWSAISCASHGWRASQPSTAGVPRTGSWPRARQVARCTVMANAALDAPRFGAIAILLRAA